MFHVSPPQLPLPLSLLLSALTEGETAGHQNGILFEDSLHAIKAYELHSLFMVRITAWPLYSEGAAGTY